MPRFSGYFPDETFMYIVCNVFHEQLFFKIGTRRVRPCNRNWSGQGYDTSLHTNLQRNERVRHITSSHAHGERHRDSAVLTVRELCQEYSGRTP